MKVKKKQASFQFKAIVRDHFTFLIMSNTVKSSHHLVSVLIPTYNAGEYLCHALQSILIQTYSNLEIFIIDDGCTDGCLDFIKNIKDTRVRVLHQANSGKATALNNALEIIQGDFWLIQDADDISYPDRIQKQLDELINCPDLAAVFAGHDLLLDTTQFAPAFSPMTKEVCKEEILNFRIPAHDATGMYRTEQVKDFRFTPELRIGQGVDFIFKIGEKFPVSRIGYCLYTYRINYNSTIRKDPTQNIIYINKVIDQAFKRRNCERHNFKSAETWTYKTKKRALNNHIIPHCISSIMDHKNINQKMEALRVGIQCLKIDPYDVFFYKPIAFVLLPLSIINFYRKIKQSLSTS